MYKLHRLPFEELIKNIVDITDKHKAGFTFPTVASVANEKPELLKSLTRSGCEVAVHGYKHLKYPLLSQTKQKEDIRKALETYARLGVKVNGFRAPYNSYDSNTPRMIEEAGFLWDAGIGNAQENRTRTDFFRVKIDGRESKFVCIPLNKLSDDVMIEKYQYTPDQMTMALKGVLDEAKKSRALTMFDLHPIRMGQPENAIVLDRLIAYGKSIGGWFPTVSDAVNYRMGHNDWGASEFCCLLTGDIDTFHFRDYLKRLF